MAKDKSSADIVSKKVKKKKKEKRLATEGEEAGEETDEGDMESREVDYMSDSSSNSELEFLVMASWWVDTVNKSQGALDPRKERFGPWTKDTLTCLW